ncbi:hypothetical protein V8C86DRAFT_1005879 [Haematococcus lacustris]
MGPGPGSGMHTTPASPPLPATTLTAALPTGPSLAAPAPHTGGGGAEANQAAPHPPPTLTPALLLLTAPDPDPGWAADLMSALADLGAHQLMLPAPAPQPTEQQPGAQQQQQQRLGPGRVVLGLTGVVHGSVGAGTTTATPTSCAALMPGLAQRLLLLSLPHLHQAGGEAVFRLAAGSAALQQHVGGSRQLGQVLDLALSRCKGEGERRQGQGQGQGHVGHGQDQAGLLRLLHRCQQLGVRPPGLVAAVEEALQQLLLRQASLQSQQHPVSHDQVKVQAGRAWPLPQTSACTVPAMPSTWTDTPDHLAAWGEPPAPNGAAGAPPFPSAAAAEQQQQQQQQQDSSHRPCTPSSEAPLALQALALGSHLPALCPLPQRCSRLFAQLIQRTVFQPSAGASATLGQVLASVQAMVGSGNLEAVPQLLCGPLGAEAGSAAAGSLKPGLPAQPPGQAA